MTEKTEKMDRKHSSSSNPGVAHSSKLTNILPPKFFFSNKHNRRGAGGRRGVGGETAGRRSERWSRVGVQGATGVHIWRTEAVRIGKQTKTSDRIWRKEFD